MTDWNERGRAAGPSRRTILTRLLGLGTGLAISGFGRTSLAENPAVHMPAAGPHNIRLIAGSSGASLVGHEKPQTRVWAYDGQIPGPTLRLRQGEPVRITVENRSEEHTSELQSIMRISHAVLCLKK